jgi:hypothetical protein
VEEFRMATWTVRETLTKELELTEEIEDKKINVTVITETKMKLKGT